MLIHWPGAACTPPSSPANATLRLETWRELERAHSQGSVRAIAVSNFGVAHLQALLPHVRVPIAVDQVEVHPLLQQRELRQFCDQHSIAVTAYSSLGCGDLLRSETVCAVAERESMPPATLLLRWALQHGMVVIPKSCTSARVVAMAPNVLLSGLVSDEAMAALDDMQDGHKYCWDSREIL